MTDRVVRPARVRRPGRAAWLTVVLLGATLATAQEPAAPGPGAGAQTLKQAAAGRFLIGAAVGTRSLDNPKLAELIAGQFDCLTAENEFKPASLRPRPGEFRFTAADRIADFAREHGQQLIGHTLCWHSQAPRWLFQDADGQPLPREQALANLKAHIDGVAGHFKGRVHGWDVVNEAISDQREGYLRHTPALRAIGTDYLVKAFEFAQAADPDAELYYNDYNVEQPEKLWKTVRLVRGLKAAGVRIDGVGIQGHFKLGDPGVAARLDRAIAALGAEGVKVMITELDVDVLPRATPGADVAAREAGGANPYVDGLPPEVARAQAELYGAIFAVVAKHPGVVTRVTFWGTHDGTSWLNGWPVRGRTNHPLLWDRSLAPKTALAAVLGALDPTAAVGRPAAPGESAPNPH